MNYTTLEKNAEYLDETLKIIEKSFNYSSDNSFYIDFNPLMRKDNQKHCHLLIESGKVIGHIGALRKKIKVSDKEFVVTMYGGIAIKKEYRGRGLFRNFFDHVLSKYSSTCMHMLWSDQLEMYEKFGFYPCIDQYEYDSNLNDAFEYSPNKLSDLNDHDLTSLKAIYDAQPEIRFSRSLTQWKELQEITSSDLYLKRNKENIIENYFFMNKGEDLNGVIIEVGDFNDFDEVNNYGVVWSPHIFEENSESLYATTIRPGDHDTFKKFIETYTQSIITNIKINNKNVSFNFEGNSLELNFSDFITGILGPNSFEELSDLSPLYISGLDSI